MSKEGSVFYNYTNKGITYQFDLSKLTPEERQKFSRLNDRQKRKFITLFDLEEPGKMKDEIAIRPDYNDEKINERNNDLRTLTAKMEYINDIIKNKKFNNNDEVNVNLPIDNATNPLREKLINDSNGLVSSTDISYITNINSNANIQTLKKYYQTLIDNLKSEGESAKMKKTLGHLTLSRNMTNASPEALKGFMTDFSGLLKELISNFKLLQTPKSDLIKEEVKKQEELKDIKKIVAETGAEAFNKTKDEMMEILTDELKMKELNEQIETYNNLDFSSIDYNTEGYNKMSQERDDVENILPEAAQKSLSTILETLSEIPSKEKRAKKYNKVIDAITKNFKIDEISEREPDVKSDYPASIQNYYGYVSELFDKGVYKNMSAKKLKQYELKHNVPPQLILGKSKDAFPISNEANKYKNATANYVSTLLKISEDNPEFKDSVKKYFDDRIKTNKNYKSGSIKDRIRRIFRGDLEDRTKTLTDTSSKQSQDIEGLKKRIDILETKIEAMKPQNIPMAPSIPQPKPVEQKETNNNFLNDIKEASNKHLKPIEQQPVKNIVDDNSLEAQLLKVMNDRRKDIAYDEDEQSEEDEDWAAGIGGMPKIVSLADFLSSRV